MKTPKNVKFCGYCNKILTFSLQSCNELETIRKESKAYAMIFFCRDHATLSLYATAIQSYDNPDITVTIIAPIDMINANQ